MKNTIQIFLLPIFFLLASFATAAAQQPDEAEPKTRSISSLDFQTQRPSSEATVKNNASPKAPVANQKRRKSIAVLTNPKRNWKWVRRIAARKAAAQTAAKTKRKPLQPLREEKVGVTFWRLRPPRDDERADAPTFPVNTGDGTDYWTAERVRATTRFKVEDLVRFTIESSRNGYLYIANREVYTDGTSGEARLIYPTLKTRGRAGDNRVTAGSMIEIPPAGVGNLRIKSTRKDYAGEEVVVVISPTRLPNFKLDLEALPVSETQMDKWLSAMQTIDIFDATDGEGVAMTRTEAEAVAASRALVQEEPTPQTIYTTKARANEPLIILFQMQAKTP